MDRRDRRRIFPFHFDVPEGVSALQISFGFLPGSVGDYRNLITLQLHDGAGFRGAAHRWCTEQVIIISLDRASPGFYPGPINAGEWVVELATHEILSDADKPCRFRLAVDCLVGDLPMQTQGMQTQVDPRLGSLLVPGDDPRESLPGPMTVNGRAGWYKGDLHSHSLHCDGTGSVDEMAEAAARRGLDFLALTSHNTVTWGAYESAWPTNLLRIRGMECTTFFGHANILGSASWVDWRTQRPQDGTRLLEQARERDALFVINHPAALGNPHCTGCRWEYTDVGMASADCIEIWNGPWATDDRRNPDALRQWTDALNRGVRTPAVAGSDNHNAAQYERDRELPMTWVYADSLSEKDVLVALRRGHSFLSSGTELYVTAHDGEGTEHQLPSSCLRQGCASIDIRVERLEEDARVYLSSDAGTEEIGSLNAPGGRLAVRGAPANEWFRIEVYAGEPEHSRLLAITNPFYLV